jgi:hypothetical protein
MQNKGEKNELKMQTIKRRRVRDETNVPEMQNRREE